MDRFRRNSSTPWVFGHRGAGRSEASPGATSSKAAENTLASFALALAQGADGVELDARISGDGIAVVCHDADLTRTANCALAIHEASARDIVRASAAGGAPVPTLDETLDFLLGRHALINIEVKESPLASAVLWSSIGRCLRRHGRTRRAHILVSSFARSLLTTMASQSLGVGAAWLWEQDCLRVPRGSVAAALHPHESLIERRKLRRWRRSGRVVNAWTVNDGERVAELVDWGIDGLITDDVPLVRRTLART